MRIFHRRPPMSRAVSPLLKDTAQLGEHRLPQARIGRRDLRTEVIVDAKEIAPTGDVVGQGHRAVGTAVATAPAVEVEVGLRRTVAEAPDSVAQRPALRPPRIVEAV